MRTRGVAPVAYAVQLFPFSRVVVSVVVVWILQPTIAASESGSKLSEVVEEAKKPVEEQKPVHKKADQEEDGFNFSAFLSFIFDNSTSSCDSRSSCESAPQLAAELEGWSLSLASLHLRSASDVVASLSGAGIEVGLPLSHQVDAQAGVYYLRGELDAESPAVGALARPEELSVGALARVYASETRKLGLNGFIGCRYGQLSWRYRNPVFAIDPYGYGRDVGDDSIKNIFGFVGVGITPFRSRLVEAGLELGAGRRIYWMETTEGFRNDLFEDSWFTQLTCKLTLHF